ncbi:unnamed protein product [Porites evermanni]|uniref:Uncharacterized protein n=1 Tax=Porites evermanni TaxID=104178 RepID=A0ABN8S173_9CNID|nr:unnamed protein product [Porites evermanni]
MQFSTKDADNDGSSANCAETQKGGWWYNACSWANPNGVYYTKEKPAPPSKMFFLLIVFFFTTVYSTSRISAPGFQAVNFAQAKERRKLNGSVLKQVDVMSEDECSLRCVGDERCLSYNFGNTRNESGTFVCELSDSDRFFGFGNFTEDNNFTYRGLQSICESNNHLPCGNKGICIPDYFRSSFECKCHAGYVGIPCKEMKSCFELSMNGFTSDGVYHVIPDGGKAIKVLCDMSTEGGGWTVFQRRLDGSVDFQLDWEFYKNGFGDLSGEFWLGNDNLHRLTINADVILRIDLEDFDGNITYAEYSTFKVADEVDKYRILLGGYNGIFRQISMSMRYTLRDFSLRKETMDPKNDNFSFISITTIWTMSLKIRYLLERTLNVARLAGEFDEQFHLSRFALVNYRSLLSNSCCIHSCRIRSKETLRIMYLKYPGLDMIQGIHLRCGSIISFGSIIRFGVLSICESSNHLPCGNKGICIPDYFRSSFECKCHAGYVGIPCKEMKSCFELSMNGFTSDGVYHVIPDGGKVIKVLCDMTTEGGGWTVFQRRLDGSVDFQLDWEFYKNGFGDLSGEFWLGNDNLHRLTTNADVILRIDLEDFDGNITYAEYSTFKVADEVDKYRILLGGYNGTTGDSMAVTSSHNMQFSTKERDNDLSSVNCAVRHKGGWWYNQCSWANLNGVYYGGEYSSQYGDGVKWVTLRGQFYSFKRTEMKVKPKV